MSGAPPSRARAHVCALASLLSACSLVGYGEQIDHAEGSDGSDSVVPISDAATHGDARARDEMDGSAPSSLDATLATALDGGTRPVRDGGLLEGGWWIGLSPDTTCADNQKCYPTCDPATSTCVFDCASATECQDTCLPGTACEVACEQVGHCFMACKEDSQCWESCQNAGDCEGWCAKGSHCQLDCAASPTCHAMCLPGAFCELDCRGGADCSGFMCMLGAECLVQCASSSCDFDCEGAALSCPGNIRVCNRACP